MNKKEIIDELHKMGYEVKEETLVKNGVNVLGVSIIDSDRFMIPVFHKLNPFVCRRRKPTTFRWWEEPCESLAINPDFQYTFV